MPKDVQVIDPAILWFVTLRLADRRAAVLVEQVALLRAAVALAQARWPFAIDTAAVLPAEALMIWALPPGDCDISARLRLIRSAFARNLPDPAPARLWADPPPPVPLTDPGNLDLHRHLCLTAPVRAGLVRRPSDWPHSSAARRRAGARPPARSGIAVSPEMTLAH